MNNYIIYLTIIVFFDTQSLQLLNNKKIRELL